MSAPTLTAGRLLPSRVHRIWKAWSGPVPQRASRGLFLAGAATLFLFAAATFQLVYTIRVPYLLFVAAIATGFPFVVRGWSRAPSWVRWTAFALVAVYVLATVAGDQRVLADGRAGSHRDLVYLADLGVGVASVGLVLGLWPAGRARWPVISAVATGAFVVSGYALYQWFAQHYGLPLSDLNNGINTTGVTGRKAPGLGLLGWERVHGTFPEPHSLGAYLAACLPLGILVTVRWTGRLRTVAQAGVGAILCALLLTVTVPGWGALVIGASAGLALFAVGRGWTGAAALGGTVLVVVASAVPVLAVRPALLSGVTNRHGNTLQLTTEFRTQAWSSAVRVWERRPAVGFGPGQSSVQLADERDQTPGAPPNRGLPSAQGVWAASLIDAGVLGIGAWVLFLGGVLVVAGLALVRRPDEIGLACFVAAAVTVITSQLGDDRLDIFSWTLLGLALAAAVRPPAEPHGAQSHQ